MLPSQQTTTSFVLHVSSKRHLKHSTERGKKKGEEEGSGGGGVHVVKHSACTNTFDIPVHKACHKRLLALKQTSFSKLFFKSLSNASPKRLNQAYQSPP